MDPMSSFNPTQASRPKDLPLVITGKTVKTYLKDARANDVSVDFEKVAALDDTTESQASETSGFASSVPHCDRCHDLVHSSRGTSIDHPSIENIADSVAESPHKRNHVYHVLDAADFPMSLIPSIHSYLSLAKPRSQNRRSQHQYTVRPTMSFIITRSDLLAPTKEKVDSLMPYFREVLRKALGRSGEGMRLGNLHLVSSKRGWWTSELKKEIRERGGGNWMIGKFNVGKSNLFEGLFPKGSGGQTSLHNELPLQEAAEERRIIPDFLPESQLLPPPQVEVPYPTLPLVSSLPGTTASPIRIPFGNNKGELIDMPGLERGNLEWYIQPEHKLDLVMTSRPTVKQHKLKPGQSLLLGGGVVRITPVLGEANRDMVVLAYPFVPLEAHVTSTDKAIGTQQQERESGIASILAADIGSHFQSAGVFSLETDVTKHHASAVLRSGVPLSRLPFRVYSTDILIQGVGWVELVCQVRRKPREKIFMDPNSLADGEHTELSPGSDLSLPHTAFKPYSPQLQQQSQHPTVEVFTPNGEHVSSRMSMSAWSIWKDGRVLRSRDKPSRQRKPMSGEKAQRKRQAAMRMVATS
ncbi:uncharacterized protein HMPREF1541_02646 [Cyphellophora europaea CBS 101466]|uniref:G domain-containing protein n=1 Tax=Cyphellophora europaea (strain CBS 101466) TaxID=1220924 RepID=W2S478_CYPE1|nr:uncharacterized protein HMPREF1541_02646 [Cyphellophora europaea CBS 101466]ETN43487.1 hypothetical protein HMPREF1541_02646 [Cyphellophora europaea CBS 101466]